MRKKLFTDSVLAQIPQWMRDEGLSAAQIAEKIGCTVGTLRVLCSRHGISLKQQPSYRQPRRSYRRPRNSDASGDDAHTDITLSLPNKSRFRLNERAGLLGLSDAELVSLLIETIDRDDLYSAVLDDRDEREESTGRRKPA
jgi:hypothetical protein